MTLRDAIAYIKSSTYYAKDLLGNYSYEGNQDLYVGDCISEYAESLVDVYTSDLMEWLYKNPMARTYVENAIDDSGWNGSLADSIMAGQWLYYEEAILDEADYICTLYGLYHIRKLYQPHIENDSHFLDGVDFDGFEIHYHSISTFRDIEEMAQEWIEDKLQ